MAAIRPSEEFRGSSEEFRGSIEKDAFALKDGGKRDYSEVNGRSH